MGRDDVWWGIVIIGNRACSLLGWILNNDETRKGEYLSPENFKQLIDF